MRSRDPLFRSWRTRAAALVALSLLPLAAGRSAAQTWPATEIYLAPLQGAGPTLTAGPARPMAAHPGYDNQPFFTPDGQAVLFTSERAADQTEIFRFALASGEVMRLTDTGESEYSPTPLPEGGFSVVRVEPDGTQRLWRFDATGGAARLVLPEIKGVGYHAWGGSERLALFVLGEPPTLQMADVASGKARVVRSGIGRSLHAIPGRDAWSFVAPLEGQEPPGKGGKPWVQQLAWDSGEMKPIAPVVDAEGDHDLAWTPDGVLLMAKGSELHAWDPAANAWRKVRDFAPDGLTAITRLAVSPHGDRLALVSRESDARRPAEVFRQAVERFEKAQEAHDRQDWHAWRLGLDEAAKGLPPQAGLERRRAGALARDGRPDEALRRLERLVAWRATADLADDADLAALQARPEWAALVKRQAEALQPTARSQVAFRAGEADFVPEGLTRDPKTGDFFLASLRKGIVLRVSREGKGKSRRFADVRAAGYGSAVGLAVDAARRRLWVVASDFPMADNFSPQAAVKTALCSFDLDSGRALGCFPPPAAKPEGAGAPAGHRFDDLAVGSDGTVYVSDGQAPAILRLPPGGKELAAWVGGAEVVGPNGLALSARGDALYVADYAMGLLRIELATGKASVLRSDAMPLPGIDGLTRWHDSLIGVQNGVVPHRILRLDLNPNGDAVQGVAVLELGRAEWDEPTLGVVAGDDYYYVGNSHGGRFGADGKLKDGAPLTPPAVMRIAKGDLARK